jgi:hypothetical protein
MDRHPTRTRPLLHLEHWRPDFDSRVRESHCRIAGQGSRATLAVEFKGLLGWLVARVMKNLNEEYVGMEAAGLKRRCEGK